MIVFDLSCAHGHVFEAWFGSSADYEDQRARLLIACPVCGDTHVEKAVMAPNVAAKSNRKSSVPVPTPAAPAPMAAGVSADTAKAMMAALMTMQQQIEASAEDVGDRFAEEARRIHYGERDEAAIIGEATLQDAAELHEEGISVLPLPFKRRKRRNA